MKKILMLVTKNFDRSFFLKAARDLNVVLDIHLYSELSFCFDNKTGFLIKINSKEIKKYDLIFLRKIGSNLEFAALVSEYCRKNDINIVDPVFKHEKPYIDRKSFEYARLVGLNLPIINSYFLSNKSFSGFKDEINFPCVAKKTDGGQGEGVFLCKSNATIEKLFNKYKTYLLIQDYLKNDGDLRILVVGNEAVGAIKRSSLSNNEFRNNISLGGKAQVYQLSKEQRELAIKASQALDYSISGVDLIFDSTDKKWKIIEVNRTPQFIGFMKATGIDVPKKIIEFLKNQI